MKGNAKVQKQKNKKTGQEKYWILIPSAIVNTLKIKQGNRLDFDMDNPRPDHVEPIKLGNNFKSNENPEPEQPKSVI